MRVNKKISRCMDCPLYKNRKESAECSHPLAPKFPGNIPGTIVALKSIPKWCPLKVHPYILILTT